MFTSDGLALVNPEKYDFCILSIHDPLTDRIAPILEEAGWQVYAESEEFVVVYVSPEYSG